MARTPILAGNWKMHGTTAEAKALAGGLAARVGSRADRGVVLAPPFTALATVRDAVAGTRIVVAAQNMSWADKGAFTGEVSPGMLADLGVNHVILGHSERRALFGETDAMIDAKVQAALAAGLTPIVCVGESLEEREAGRTEAVVTAQLLGSLAGLPAADLPRIVEIYNAAIPGRMATADTEPVTVAMREAWFREFDPARRPLWVHTEGADAVTGAMWLRRKRLTLA